MYQLAKDCRSLLPIRRTNDKALSRFADNPATLDVKSQTKFPFTFHCRAPKRVDRRQRKKILDGLERGCGNPVPGKGIHKTKKTGNTPLPEDQTAASPPVVMSPASTTIAPTPSTRTVVARPPV